MKQLMIVLCCLVGAVCGAAQAQELEQLKLNLEKLVQLKLMLARAKEGYQILQKGYQGVRDAAKGNFDLHQRELDRLLVVPAQVKKLPSIGFMRSEWRSAENRFEDWWRFVKGLHCFTVDEFGSIRSDYASLVSGLKENEAQVELVLQPGVLRMNDAERIAAIEMIVNDSRRMVQQIDGLIKKQSRIAGTRQQLNKDKAAMLRQYGME